MPFASRKQMEHLAKYKPGAFKQLAEGMDAMQFHAMPERVQRTPLQEAAKRRGKQSGAK